MTSPYSGYSVICPDLTPTLLAAADQGPIALIQGISTTSELMFGMEMGYTEFKFFPAEAAGGVRMLKFIGGPFPRITFCPTGGVSPENYRYYLALKNVACVGDSWLMPADVIEQEEKCQGKLILAFSTRKGKIETQILGKD